MKYIGSEKHLINVKNARIVALEKNRKNKIERIGKYNITPNICDFCCKSLCYEKKNNKFCSSSCAAKYNNKERILTNQTKKKISDKLKDFNLKNPRNVDNFDDKFCRQCNGKLTIRQIKRNNIFCSNSCTSKFRSNNKEYRNEMSKIMKQKAEQGLLKGWATRNIVSYPEQFFIEVLNNNNISFQHNYPVNKRDLGLDDSSNYFLDFYIEDKNIDLEIDGKQHKYRKEHDNKRDELLIRNNYIVYRIKWKDINSENGKLYIKNEIDKFLLFYHNI